MGHFKGVLFGVISAISGVASLICMKIIIREYAGDVYTIITLRAMVMVMLTPIFISASKSTYIPERCNKIPYLVFRGVLSLLSCFTLAAAQLYIPMGESYTLLNLTPGFTVILGFLILRERISLLDFMSLIFLFAGGLFTTQPDFIFNKEDTDSEDVISSVLSNRIIGSLLALASALTMAMVSVICRYLKEISPFTQSGWAVTVTTILMVPASYIFGGGLSMCQNVSRVYIVCSGVSFAAALISYTASFKEMPVAIAGLTPMACSCILGFLFDVVYFDEELTTYSILGATLVMVALFLILLKGIGLKHIGEYKLKWLL